MTIAELGAEGMPQMMGDHAYMVKHILSAAIVIQR